MFDLPKTSEIRKPLHKKLIYEKYAAELSGNKKDKFDADISRMIITNEISEASVNIKATEVTSAIFLLHFSSPISTSVSHILQAGMHFHNAAQSTTFVQRVLIP